MLHLKFGMADMKGALIQSGPITRDIFVKPPKFLEQNRSILWKLKELPYGVVDAGRQWIKVADEWMSEIGFELVLGIMQLLVARGYHGTIKMIVAKTTDEFQVDGNPVGIRRFLIE